MSASWRELDLREFGDWPLAYRAGACALLALLALALPWLLLTRQTVAERQALVMAETDVQARLIEGKEQLEHWPPVLASSIAAEPPPLHLPKMMLVIHEAATAAGLRDGQLRPHPSTAADAGADVELPAIDLRLSGTWAQLVCFAQALAAADAEAIFGVQEIHLRGDAAAAQVQLGARVRVYPQHVRDEADPRVQPEAWIAPRNPFADSRARAHHFSAQTVIGSIRSGHGQAGLVLGEDGQLRRVVSGPRPPRNRSEP